MQQYILDFQVSLDAVRAEWPHMFPDPPPPPGVDLHQLGGLLILLLALGSIFYIHSTLAAQAQEIKPFQETFTRLDAQISELSHGVDSLLPPELLIHRAELAKVCQYWQTFASARARSVEAPALARLNLEKMAKVSNQLEPICQRLEYEYFNWLSINQELLLATSLNTLPEQTVVNHQDSALDLLLLAFSSLA